MRIDRRVKRGRRAIWAGALLALAAALPAEAAGKPPVETPLFEDRVAKGELPPVAERLPKTPLVVDLAGRGRTIGRHGGEVVTLIGQGREIRFMSVVAYSRLVGYDENRELKPDLLEKVEIGDGGRAFTFTLREGHRWSDGAPFTSEDFRYWFEDVAGDKELSPTGLPEFMLVDDRPPRFEVIDERTVRYIWDEPNPRFLPQLAAPRDPEIFRPAHYLRQFHAKYGVRDRLNTLARGEKLKGWASLHNRRDDMYGQSNPDQPTLNAWRVRTSAPASRFVFERNPYYHRIDAEGQQLPYVDRVMMDVSAGGLMAAKANAGELDLLYRGLHMADIPILKEGEKAHGYKTLLWQNARGSEVALYPNLNVTDPVWRALNRDVRFRKALSRGIDRRTLNNALLFGRGREGNNTVLAESALFSPELRTLNAQYDPAAASRLLDEVGLTKRNGAGIRLLPDGRELEIVVETDGDGGLVVDALTLIAEFWREIGIKLFVKPQDRAILRNRAYAGLTVMTASQGLENAIPTASMPPTELAPMRQDNLVWPKWGQYVETKGKTGEPIDMPEAEALARAYDDWMSSPDDAGREAAWRTMLRNHAENQWIIGTVAGAIQPIVRRNELRNIPDKALYSWVPTALLGAYRVDEFYWDRAAGKEAGMRSEPDRTGGIGR